jgi:hypothetical protein
MDYTLTHVKLEGVLCISVLRNRATLYKKLGFKTAEFSKSQIFKTPAALGAFHAQGDSLARIDL